MRADSLRRRLVVLAILWAALATAAAGTALAFSFRTAVERGVDQQLTTLLSGLLGGLERDEGGELLLPRPPPDPRFDQLYSGWYWAVAEGDAVRFRSRSLWDADLALRPDVPRGTPAFRDDVDSTGRPLRIAQQSVLMAPDADPVTVLVSADATATSLEIRTFNRILVTGLAVLAVGLVLAVVIQVHVGLRPLREMAAGVEKVRLGQAARVEPAGVGELDPLVDAVNSLIADSERGLARSRAGTGDLAHALKTPLAVMRAHLDELDPAAAAACRGPLADMQRILERQLARAAAGGPRSGRATPVAPVADAIVAAMARLHGHRGLHIESSVPPGTRFPGDPEDLEEMLGNLLDNACKWARSRVRVTARETGARELVLRVEDDGPGIDPALAERALERGQRLDTSVPGTGLGLAIVADLAELYDGQLGLGTSPLGGLAAGIRLPAPEAAPTRPPG